MSRASLWFVAVVALALPACTSRNPLNGPGGSDLAVAGEPHPAPADLAVWTPPDDLAAPAGAPRDMAQPPYVPIDGGGEVGIIELVSPAVCQWKNGLLVECHIGTVVLPAPAPSEAAPFMTVLQTKKSGNCSTNYPLEYKVQADSDPPVLFNPYNSTRMLITRRLDRAAIATLTVENSSVWESRSAYHDDCRIWLEVAFNRHDPN